MQKHVFILSLCFVMILAACTKGPGTGGRASLKGKVFARNYSNSFVLIDSGYIGGVNVYIKYGDQPGVGDNVDTDNEGVYLFPYLRPGDYTIYAFSKTLTNNTLDSAVVKKVTIRERKEEIEVPQIDIITLKN